MPAQSIVDPATRTVPWPGELVPLQSPGARGARREMRLMLRRTPGPAGAPLAFHVHGLGGSSTNWTDLSTAISGQLSSVAVDLPGFGLSDPAPDKDYSIASNARWVIAAIEQQASGPVHLTGNSMGGLIAIAVTASRPDLVASLTLISPAVPGFDTTADSDPRMALLALPYLGPRLQRRFGRVEAQKRAQMTIDLCFADQSRVTPERLAQAAAEVQARSGLPWTVAAFTRSLRSIVAVHLHRRPSNPWRLAASIGVPTMVIWGDRDRLVPVTRAARLASVITDSQLRIFENVGHTAMLEVPELTADAMLELVSAASGRVSA